ncbi:MAG: hypothetical protein ACJAT3_000705, partial [Akkermansiaceae bacterium]
MGGFDGGFGEFEFGLELVDDFGAEEVFHHVGIAVDVAGGNIGVSNQIEFPEAVVSGDSRGFAKAGFGEAKFAGGLSFHVVFGAGLADQFREFP